MRGADEGFGEFLSHNAARRGLVRGVEEAVKEADGDCLDAGIPQHPDRAAHRNLVERGFDTSVVAQPFRHFPAQPALDEHWGFVRLQIVQVGPFLPTNFEEVAKPAAGDQPGRCAAMLNQRIGRHRRPVAEIADIACLRSKLCERFADAMRDRMRGIGRG